MKIRVGFVSNSSTSSFCIYGCYLGQEEALELLLTSGVISKEQAEDGKDDSYDVFDDIATNNKIEFHSMPYVYTTWFGFNFPSIPDDVNVGEWKKEKEKALKKLFGDSVKCDIYSEAWNDC